MIFRDLDIAIPDDEEDEDAVIERRRKEREKLLKVRILVKDTFTVFLKSNL